MIFRRDGKTEVEGLTTATGVLLTAGIGICVALRQLVLAVGVTLVTMLILRGLVWVEQRVAARAKSTREAENETAPKVAGDA